MNIVYDAARHGLLNGTLNLRADTIKVMLVSDVYMAKPEHKTRSDVAGEIAGTGYVAGGKSLTVRKAEAKGTVIAVQADPLLWSPSTLKARGAVIYKAAKDAADEALITYLDFGRDVVSYNAEFRVEFPDGILAL